MGRIFTYLLVDLPDAPHKVVLWDTLEITVGRGKDQDIVVHDEQVSRQHALFQLDGDEFVVADLHTANGTRVNGATIARHVLRSGDFVEVGGATLTFRSEPESPMGKGVDSCFASQLKGFGPQLDEAGGRTVLGLAPSDEVAGADLDDYADLGPVGERQLDLDGDFFEEVRATSGGLPELDPDLTLGGGADLEPLELPGFDDEDEPEKPEPPQAEELVVEAVPTHPPATAAAPQGDAAAPRSERVAATLAVELSGPRDALRAVLEALLDRELSLGPLTARLRRPEG